MHSRAWHGARRKDRGRHHVAGVADPPGVRLAGALRWQRLFRSCVPGILANERRPAGEAGILTNFLGGNAGLKDAKSALDAFSAGLAKMSPKMAESLDPKAVTSMFWNTYRYTLGSYSAAKVGQYTTMLHEAGKPALNGRLQFAGEHTAGAKLFGYMNGGVLSGNRAAKELVERLWLRRSSEPAVDER